MQARVFLLAALVLFSQAAIAESLQQRWGRGWSCANIADDPGQATGPQSRISAQQLATFKRQCYECERRGLDFEETAPVVGRCVARSVSGRTAAPAPAPSIASAPQSPQRPSSLDRLGAGLGLAEGAIDLCERLGGCQGGSVASTRPSDYDSYNLPGMESVRKAKRAEQEAGAAYDAEHYELAIQKYEEAVRHWSAAGSASAYRILIDSDKENIVLTRATIAFKNGEKEETRREYKSALDLYMQSKQLLETVGEKTRPVLAIVEQRMARVRPLIAREAPVAQKPPPPAAPAQTAAAPAFSAEPTVINERLAFQANQAGIAAYKAKNFESAVDEFQKALNYYTLAGKENDIALARRNVAGAKGAIAGTKGGRALDEQDYQAAYRHWSEAKSLYTEAGIASQVAVAEKNMNAAMEAEKRKSGSTAGLQQPGIDRTPVGAVGKTGKMQIAVPASCIEWLSAAFLIYPPNENQPLLELHPSRGASFTWYVADDPAGIRNSMAEYCAFVSRGPSWAEMVGAGAASLAEGLLAKLMDSGYIRKPNPNQFPSALGVRG